MGNNLITHVKKLFDNDQTEIQSISAKVDMNYSYVPGRNPRQQTHADNFGNIELVTDMANGAMEKNLYGVSEYVACTTTLYHNRGPIDCHPSEDDKCKREMI